MTPYSNGSGDGFHREWHSHVPDTLERPNFADTNPPPIRIDGPVAKGNR